MHNNFMLLFATFVLLTLLLDTNRAHSLDVNRENVVNITGKKQKWPLPNDEEESNRKFSVTIDSTKEPLYLDKSRDDTNFKPIKESITSTPSARGNSYRGFISSRYPNMPIYLKKKLQKTHAKLEKKRVTLSNMSQRMRNLPRRMEMNMKRIFSNQFPFNGGANDDYVSNHDDYSREECCDHDEEYMERFEDEMDAFQDYVEDYNDHLEDYIDALNVSSPNSSQANKVRIDISSGFPMTSGSRIVITESQNGSPYPSQIMSTNLRPNSVLQIRGRNTGLPRPGIFMNKRGGQQRHAANYYNK